MPQASINIDLDTLCEEIDTDTRIVRAQELRAITYERLIPRFLELLDRHDVKATFFVIGRDADDHENVLRQIAEAGHELANHTMNHPKQLSQLDEATVAREIESCSRRLEPIAGRPIVGFRAPGYTISPAVVRALKSAGYRYDSSLNTSLSYNAIKRVFKTFRLKDQEYVCVQPVVDLFGPHKPYHIQSERLSAREPNGSLIEIPISVIPLISYPFVTSLLIPFGDAPTLAALRMLVACDRFVNCELHINEFTDRSDIEGLPDEFFFSSQYARIPLQRRMTYFDRVISAIKRSCDIVLLREVTA